MQPDSLDKIFDNITNSLTQIKPNNKKGHVIQVIGVIIKALIDGVCIGEICQLKINKDNHTYMLAEVVGIDSQYALLMPYGDLQGVSAYTEVIATGKTHTINIGEHLLGQILNGFGFPLNKAENTPVLLNKYSIYNEAPSAMLRKKITQPAFLGVPIIDSLLTCGEGQRLGIFAGAGMGKSTLLASIICKSDFDIIILALIGERGRELREFIDNDLGEIGLKKTIIIVATADKPAIERVKAAFVATAIAEYFRDQGLRVLLMMDSLSRFARAQREIGLAAGEPAIRRGYPSSVFTLLPQLLERAGQSLEGSITALYTVLIEGNDFTDPIADETRSLLDGHIILSEKLAQLQCYPAIDILQSASRVMNKIINNKHKKISKEIKFILAQYQEIEIMLQIGEYKYGNDNETDLLIDKYKKIKNWLYFNQKNHDNINDTIDSLSCTIS